MRKASLFRALQLRPLLAAAIVAGFVALSGSGQAETLRIGGTGSALALMDHLGEGFTAQRPEATVEVVPSLGSADGIRALVAGAIDIAVSSRPLKEAEAAQHLESLPLLRTPFVLVTSRRQPLDLAAGDIATLYSDALAHWPDGTPLRIVLRPESESDASYLQRFFPGMKEALAQARRRPEVPIAMSDQDNFLLAQNIEGSLTTATLVQVVAEEAELTPVSIDGAAPSLENMENGRYPYSKELYIIRRASAGASVQGFFDFLVSPEGRGIQRASGALPLL